MSSRDGTKSWTRKWKNTRESVWKELETDSDKDARGKTLGEHELKHDIVLAIEWIFFSIFLFTLP